MGTTYAGSGVDYGDLDPFKLLAQLAARETTGNLERMTRSNIEFQVFEASRGESAFLIETPTSYLAHVEEGLGTKNLVAQEMYLHTGRSYFDAIAQDTVAMIVNDLVTVGAIPVSMAMHLAAGDSNWFKDEKRANDLVSGWKTACDLARCVWGPGETSILVDIVEPKTVVLSGSAFGVIKPKMRLIAGNVRHGDRIILIESSGIHASGLTLARKIAAKLPLRYLTELSNKRTLGDTLLDPTHIYVRLVETCLDREVEIHGAVNITGHGWRKLMRPRSPFTYVVHGLPRQLPIFDFLQEYGGLDDKEAYSTFNMGAGFALYVGEVDVKKVIEVASNLGLCALVAGRIEQGRKRVVIEPLDLEFGAETLQVR